MMKSKSLKQADADREVIVVGWLKTHEVPASFAHFYHEILPLIRHTVSKDADEVEVDHIQSTLYLHFAEFKSGTETAL